MNAHTKDLCLLLVTRLKTFALFPTENEDKLDFYSTLEQLEAVIKGDFLKFHGSLEKELWRKDERINSEICENRNLTNSIQRQRQHIQFLEEENVRLKRNL